RRAGWRGPRPPPGGPLLRGPPPPGPRPRGRPPPSPPGRPPPTPPRPNRPPPPPPTPPHPTLPRRRAPATPGAKPPGAPFTPRFFTDRTIRPLPDPSAETERAPARMPSNRSIEGTGVSDRADAGSDALTLAGGANARRPPKNQAETDTRTIGQLMESSFQKLGTGVGAFNRPLGPV